MARTAVTLGFTVAGAAAGAYFGNPMLGAQLGMMAGSIAGALIFPGGEDQKGPRLGDLRVADASYGLPIPIVYGAVRVGGVMIWTSGIEERSHEESMKGGGPTSTTYSYYASVAIGLCEGPISAVRKIWFDTKLVYDVSEQNLGIINQRMGDLDPRHLLTEDELNKRRSEIQAELSAVQSTLTVYLGTEDQLPDPMIEAHEGVGEVPAHRGLAYLLFADLPLAAFGNRIPSVSAEVMTEATPAYPKRTVTPTETVHVDQMVLDQARQVLWERHAQTLVQIDALNNTLVYSGPVDTTIVNNEELASPLGLALAVDQDGAIYLPTKVTSSSHRLVRVDPISHAVTHRNVDIFTGLPEALGPCSSISVSPTFVWYIAFVFPRVSCFLRPGALDPSTGLPAITMREFASVAMTGDLAGFTPSNLAIDRDETAWVVCSSGSSGPTRLLHLSPSGNFGVHDISADLGAGDFITYDAQTHAVLVRGVPPGNSSIKRIVRYDLATNSVTGTSPDFAANSYMESAWRQGVQGRFLWWPSPPGFQVFDVDSLTIVQAVDVTTWPAGQLGFGGLYDASTAAMWQMESGVGFAKYYFARQEAAPVTLGSIVEDLSRRAGLQDVDVETATLTDPVHGFAMSQRSEARASVDTLLSAFLADGVESDWALRFQHRTLQPVATLTVDDLAAHEPGGTVPDVLTPVRLDDQQLPVRVDITYADPARDYQDTVQHARRFQAGQRARSQREVRTPVILTANQARHLAEETLSEAWVSRTTYTLSVPYHWSTIDPGDVLAIDASGRTSLVRVQQIQHGANGILELTAVAYDAHIYTASMSVGVAADAVTQQTIEFLAPTALFLLDTHLLRDVDEGAGYYMAMAPQGGGAWHGATAFSSVDGNAWRMEETITTPVSYGSTMTALAAGTPYVFDTGHTLDVRMAIGSLSSITEAELINGANAALVGNEIVQWQTATALDATTWRLSILLRGRRGTEWAIPAHVVGERFIVLSPQTLRREDMGLSEVDTSRLYRAVSNNTDMLTTSTQGFVNTALGLKPYSPEHVHGTRNPAGDLTITWVRRTRLGGLWVDGRDVPLGEASEQYDIVILDAGAEVRVLQSTTPTVVYTAADQSTDFGSPQSSIDVAIYQRGQLGRGWPAMATV
jgi:Putative phage tail protein